MTTRRIKTAVRNAVAAEMPKWQLLDSADGTVTYRLRSWTQFHDFLEETLFANEGNRRYVWRGHRSSTWSLSSTLDRSFDRLGLLSRSSSDLEQLSDKHLHCFKLAVRGRRGRNPAKLEENEWWALGQHFGLDTPLLDWSMSPFAASYFAFEGANATSNPNEFRVVFGLDRAALEQKELEWMNGPSYESGGPPVIQFIESLSDENPRLVSQGGLFTRSPIGTPVDQWVAKTFEGSTDPILLRIEIPGADRIACLKALDRMNINHSSLFPDLAGASRATNLKLELECI